MTELKTGNLRFQASNICTFIVILDADFARGSDEERTYYSEDPKLAILQTPQFFEIKPEQSWVERGAGSYRSCSIVSYKSTGMHWGC
jgi:hypothetical protein